MREIHANAKQTTGRRRIKTMDIILAVIGIALLAFTVKMILLFEQTGAIPDTLCTCVFSCLGGECGAMAWIKTTKDRQQARRWEIADREHMEQRANEIRDMDGKEMEMQDGT